MLDFLTRNIGIVVHAEDLLAYIAAVTSHPGYVDRFREDLEVPGARIPLSNNREIWKRATELGRRILWLHTFGEQYTEVGHHKQAPRLADGERPLCTTEIPDSVEEMPTTMTYDSQLGELRIGSGVIAPVSSKVREYSTSGMNVLDKWFGYRKKTPAGKRTRSLDHVASPTWRPEWTTDLLALLNVLGLLVKAQPLQEELLADILGGSLISVDELTAAGVLPVPEYSTRLSRTNTDDTLF